MLSRSAERLYWLARYLERTENTARLVSVYMNLWFDLPSGIEVGWHNLLNISGSEAAFFQRFKLPSEQNVSRFLLADANNPCSLFASLRFARENIRTSRDLMPDEAWEQVNEMYLYAKEHLDAVSSRRARVLFLQEMQEGCQRFTGFLSGAMSRDAPYRFICLGRNLERADMTTRILDIGSLLLAEGRSDKLRQYEGALWIHVLKSLSALLMYRKHIRSRVKSADVLNYLLKDGDFPRAVGYCLRDAADCIAALPAPDPVLAQLAELDARVRGIDSAALSPQALHDLLDSLQSDLASLHNKVAATWFLRGNAA